MRDELLTHHLSFLIRHSLLYQLFHCYASRRQVIADAFQIDETIQGRVVAHIGAIALFPGFKFDGVTFFLFAESMAIRWLNRHAK